MSVIRIESIYDETRIAKGSGKPYKVTVVTGIKYGTDEEWQQPIFANDKSMLAKLSEFGKGDVANFKYEQNGKFFDLIDIQVPDKALIDKIDSGEVDVPTKSQGGGKKNSSSNGFNGSTNDKMSKAEWAEKDRLTNFRIAKAVALKAAVDNTKIGTNAETLIGLSEELIPWLLNTSEASPLTEGDDPLDPPTE
jgi:hypothetical protein